MAISNPYTGGARKLNSVGKPLPGYEVKLAPLEGESSAPAPLEGFVAAGELQLRGPGVFREYWGRPEATAETFAPGGWFKTGDMGAVDAEGYFHILGRLSADIIKSGGFKISALDIERELLHHSSMAEVAVLGVPDAMYGEKVAAVILLKEGLPLPAEGSAEHAAYCAELKAFCKDKLPPYKIPSIFKVVPSIARNAMGKVNKKELRAALWPAAAAAAPSPAASPRS